MDKLASWVSELKSVVLAPLFHNLHEVLNLWVRSVLQHVNHFNKALLILSTRDNQLEDSDSRAALALPELWVGIEAFQHVESLCREVELAHFVAIISNQVQKGQTLIRGLHIDIDVPGQMRLLVHDIAAAKP